MHSFILIKNIHVCTFRDFHLKVKLHVVGAAVPALKKLC